jgi:hypothetical protein
MAAALASRRSCRRLRSFDLVFKIKIKRSSGRGPNLRQLHTDRCRPWKAAEKRQAAEVDCRFSVIATLATARKPTVCGVFPIGTRLAKFTVRKIRSPEGFPT